MGQGGKFRPGSTQQKHTSYGKTTDPAEMEGESSLAKEMMQGPKKEGEGVSAGPRSQKGYVLRELSFSMTDQTSQGETKKKRGGGGR